MLTQKEKEFVIFIEQTLIPDLKESGTISMAQDLQKCIRIIKKQNTEIKRLTDKKKKPVQ